MKYLLAVLLTIMTPFAGSSYELSVCAIFRDDARWLPEWIEFHQAQGVEHFYLYNNLSKDHPEIILKPYIDANVVTMIDWPYEHSKHSEWAQIQNGSYDDCLDRIRDTDKWCAFLDTDEFLFCPEKLSLPLLLKCYEAYPAVCAYWRTYGTSHVYKVPEGEKSVNHLVYRSNESFWLNWCPKSIVQPKFIKKCDSAHFFASDFGPTVTETLCPYSLSKSNSVVLLRINHYWTRDVDFFLNVKIARRKFWAIDYLKMIEYADKMNEIYDPILKGY